MTAISDRLSRLPRYAVIVHGGARGADRIAGSTASGLGLPVEEFLADWTRYGRRAGIVRNRAMLDHGADLVLAFWDGKSPGTKDCIEEARRRGVRVEVISL